MKNSCSLIILLVIFSFNSAGQGISFGPELGTNLVQIEKTDIGRDYHLCWLAGGQVEYGFSELFSVRSGVYFSHRKKMYLDADTVPVNVFGYELSDLGIPGVDFNEYTQTKGIISLFGVEVPLLASLNVKQFSFFGGPYMNFLVGAWSKQRIDSQIPFLQTFDIDSLDPTGLLSYLLPPPTSTSFEESSSVENMRVFDFGFKAGAGYTNNGFRMNFYYTLGLPDYRIDRAGADVNAHHYASLSIAYNFKVSRSGRSSFGN